MEEYSSLIIVERNKTFHTTKEYYANVRKTQKGGLSCIKF